MRLIPRVQIRQMGLHMKTVWVIRVIDMYFFSVLSFYRHSIAVRRCQLSQRRCLITQVKENVFTSLAPSKSPWITLITYIPRAQAHRAQSLRYSFAHLFRSTCFSSFRLSFGVGRAVSLAMDCFPFLFARHRCRCRQWSIGKKSSAHAIERRTSHTPACKVDLIKTEKTRSAFT